MARRGRTGRPYRRVRAQVLAECAVCWICGRGIDLTLPPRHPMSATTDHVIPLSLGGDPLDPANQRPAHYRCNSARGNRAVRPRLSTSRAW
jgi:5-methylcytosine-specific restriction endonuclease McrA